MLIARTESHRITQASTFDAQKGAKERGCDVVKQWDSTMDGDTRPTHKRLDGQLREIDKPFEIAGKKAMFPGDFGDPAEDCNCRCVSNTRVKWDLDEDELETLKERAAFFKLDKTAELDEFKKKYMEAAGRISVVSGSEDTAQNYRPVAVDKNDAVSEVRGKITINASKATTTQNALYISDAVKLKPKQLHAIDKSISDAVSLLGVEDAASMPKIIIVTNDEMQKNAVATYFSGKNILLLDEKLGNPESVLALQKDSACPDNPISTMLHELLHWQDATAYAQKHGAISDPAKYLEENIEKSKKKLEKLAEKGYNINGISNYASQQLTDSSYDEVYTEYRVKMLLGE